MAIQPKPDYTYIWGSGGVLVAPSNVKMQTAWVSEVPPYQWENYLQNRQDQAIAHIFQRGIAAWDGLTEYLANICYVNGTDGIIYKSKAASGPATVAQNPVTDVAKTYWDVAFASPGAFITQAAGDIRYLQKLNNLSDISSPATARTNLGLDVVMQSGIQGSNSNLKISTTGTNAAVSITMDSICVKSSANLQTVLNNLTLTPSLTTAGVNGLDTGTSSASTWYSIWVIWNGTTTAGLLSLSATAPTMPAGYTHKARVGWIRTDATANKYPLSIIQQGRSVQYKVAAGSNVPTIPILSSGVAGSITTPTWIATAVGAFVPPTAAAIKVAGNTTSSGLIVAPNNSFGALSSTTNPPPYLAFAGANNAQSSSPGLILLESTNIYLASSGASAVITCFGWEDNL